MASKEHALGLAGFLARNGIRTELAVLGGPEYAVSVPLARHTPDGPARPVVVIVNPDAGTRARPGTSWELRDADGVIRAGGWRGKGRWRLMARLRRLLASFDARPWNGTPATPDAVRSLIAGHVDRWDRDITASAHAYAQAVADGRIGAEVTDPAAVLEAVPEMASTGEVAIAVSAIHSLAAGAFTVDELSTRFHSDYGDYWHLFTGDFEDAGVLPEQLAAAFDGNLHAAARAFTQALSAAAANART